VHHVNELAIKKIQDQQAKGRSRLSPSEGVHKTLPFVGPQKDSLYFEMSVKHTSYVNSYTALSAFSLEAYA
jgi:hypothetical protein